MSSKNLFIILGLIILLISCKDKEVFTGINEVEENMDSLGKLIITSDPPNARIFLNNKNMGVSTPDTFKFLVEGIYKITLKHPYFLDSVFTTYINQSEKKEIFINYRANANNYAKIYCNSSPQGAQIFLNDSLTNEKTPHSFSGLYPGEYKIKITYPEHRSDSSSVTLLGGRKFDVYFSLEDTTEWVSYKYYNSGIGDNYFQSIEVDNSGNIWFGTLQNGISFYDKKKFIRFNSENSILQDNSINAIKTEKNGSVWIGTNNGLVKYQNGSWTNYSDAILGSNVRSIDFDSKGEMWVATLLGLFRYDGARWYEYSSKTLPSVFQNNLITSVAADKDNKIWIGIGNVGVVSYDGSNWVNYSISSMGLSSAIGNNVSRIKSDMKGNIWVGFIPNTKQGIRGGLVYFNGTSWREQRITGIGETVWQDFYFYNNKGYFASQQGFVILDESNNSTLYNIFNSKIPTADIRAIRRDKSGSLWLATMNGAMKIKTIPE
ncbi:MAG: PEGA domain-containing protein [Melioribacteraceae bacterium]|nr:PEGA domain-containing protein [Melioribacteraceae bacterium]